VIAAIHFGKGRYLDSGLRFMKLDRGILKEIFAIGLPSIVMQILTPIMTYGMNLILGSVSTSAVTAYGVYYKLQNFVFMPGYGLNNASIPIISFNRGAGEKERVRQAIRYGLLYISVIMGIGILILQLFTGQIVGIFEISGESARLCELALRIISCGFFFAGANIILLGVCQALGHGGYSLMISS